MRQVAKAFTQYKYTIYLLGFIILTSAVAFGGIELHAWPELVVFFILIFFAEILPVVFPSSATEYTMTMPAVLALFISHGFTETLLVTSLGLIASNMVFHRGKYPLRLLLDLTYYNLCNTIISITVASIAYIFSGGMTLQTGSEVTLSAVVLPVLLWVFTCTTTNALLLATALALHLREPWRIHVAQQLRWTATNNLVTGPSGILFAYLYLAYGIHGILLMIIPFLMGRQALNQYAKRLDTYRETITSLGIYMQHYHPYTKGHLERVADISDKIARQMGLPLRSLMLIRDAGLLHDVGKIGVDEQILDKVGALSEEDWAIIKQHPARGAEILSQMKHLEAIVPWVRGHHERPDGKGYPDGLKDGEIPIEAAVIAVADAFDAMTGGPDEKDRRVYRAPLTIDQAIDQVRYGAGTQFDPRVVKAFMQVMAREELEHGE
ncbi:MAG: HD-GYP domain-containing protein [Armatimonadetes bacterium]|nr:HD-GYP domain-containing protein [Armatimonadota bacterium]